MRQGTNNGRRPRGRPNRKHHGSPRSNSFESSGPEGRIRGNASQVYEKYLALARDATSSGDRVSAETFHQHAEHYFRIMNDSTDPQTTSPPVNNHSAGGPPYAAHDGRDRHRGNGREASDGTERDRRPPPNDPAGAPQPEVQAQPESASVPASVDENRAEPPVEPRPRRGRPAKRAVEAAVETSAEEGASAEVLAVETPAAENRPRRGRPPKARQPKPEEPGTEA
jgi:hypothetical protein